MKKVFLLAFIFVLTQFDIAAASEIYAYPPSSVLVGDFFTIDAIYTDGGTNVCGGTCYLTGGWVSSLQLTESYCTYYTNLNAPNEDNSYDFTLTCSSGEPAIETAITNFSILVYRRTSTLSLGLSPTVQYVGDMVTVSANYLDEYGSSITSADCEATISGSSGVIRTTSMIQSFNQYVGYLTSPDVGTYSIDVTCSHSDYYSRTDSVTLTTQRKPSELEIKTPYMIYYGDDITVEAEFEHRGQSIDGVCTMELWDNGNRLASKSMTRSSSGYSTNVYIPTIEGSYKIQVSCTAVGYLPQVKTKHIRPNRRTMTLDLVSPSQFDIWAGRDVPVSISVQDSGDRQTLIDAVCRMTIGSNTYDFYYEAPYHHLNLESILPGEYYFIVECNKALYEEAEYDFTLNAREIPIEVNVETTEFEFRPGDSITLEVSVVDFQNNDVDTSCTASIERYDVFGKIFKKDTVTLKQSLDSYITAFDADQPGTISAKISCGDEYHKDATATADYRIRLMQRESEEQNMIYLGSITVLLLVLIVLFKKKLKII